MSEWPLWTTERRPEDDAECERLGCEDRTHPVHHLIDDGLTEPEIYALNAILDRPYADPDDDAAIVSRAALRLNGRLALARSAWDR